MHRIGFDYTASVGEWLVGWLVGWMDGWLAGWMDGWLDLMMGLSQRPEVCMDVWISVVFVAFLRLSTQKLIIQVVLHAQQRASKCFRCQENRQVRPLAGQQGLSCGVDTNAGAKDSFRVVCCVAVRCDGFSFSPFECNQERNDDRVAAQDLHELGFLTGIFDGHRGTELKPLKHKAKGS